jgi:hypothetical protein
MSVQKVPARNAINWLQAAWGYFKADPLMWIGMALVWIILASLLTFIPAIGPIANIVLFPLAYAGFLYGVRELEAGRALKFEHLWQALTDAQTRTKVIVLAILPLGYTMLANVVTLGLGFNPVTGMALAVASILVSLALMFAVPLVIFKNADPLAAIKASFQAGVTNVAPLGLFLLINIVVGGLLAMVTFGLASVILLPITIAALFCAYRDIVSPKA